ncbi:hypothetical protein Tco_1477255 [Tanacetum coccineum]
MESSLGIKTSDEAKGRWRWQFVTQGVTRMNLNLENKGYCVCTLPTQWMRSIMSMVSISPEGFLPSILMLVVIIVTVVIVTVILVVVVVDDVSPILKLLFVIIGFEEVRFPSILLGNPPMKASISFSVFGTIFGHKMANS